METTLGINKDKCNYIAEYRHEVGQNDDEVFNNLILITHYYKENNLIDKFFIRFYKTLKYMQTNVGAYKSWIKFTKNEMNTQYPDLMQFLGIFSNPDASIIVDDIIVYKSDLRYIAGKSFGHIGNGKQNNPFALTKFGYKVLSYIESNIPQHQLNIDVKGKGAQNTLFSTNKKRGPKSYIKTNQTHE